MKRGKFTTGEEVAVRDALDSFREVSDSHSSVLSLVLNVWFLGKWPLAGECCRYYPQWTESQI